MEVISRTLNYQIYCENQFYKLQSDAWEHKIHYLYCQVERKVSIMMQINRENQWQQHNIK
jgi:hypothetical protein